MTEPATPPVTDPPPSPAPPADPPAPRPAVNVQTAQPDFTPLLNALGSLPEKVANAVREMTPQPPSTSSTPPANEPASTSPAKAGDQNTGGNTMPTKTRRSFGEWWHGVST